jgi:hypothetical protein
MERGAFAHQAGFNPFGHTISRHEAPKPIFSIE